MFNLLPKEDKEMVRSEYGRRLTSVILAILLSVFVISMFILSTLLVNVYFGSESAALELATLKSKPASNDYRDLENSIRGTKASLATLAVDMTGRPRILNMITEALQNKPKNIFINNISWSVGDNGAVLNLSGTASSREVLREYVLVLQSDKSFSGVDIPVSNFAKAEDADFSITIVANNANQ